MAALIFMPLQLQKKKKKKKNEKKQTQDTASVFTRGERKIEFILIKPYYELLQSWQKRMWNIQLLNLRLSVIWFQSKKENSRGILIVWWDFVNKTHIFSIYIFLGLEKDVEYIAQANIGYTGKWQAEMNLPHKI